MNILTPKQTQLVDALNVAYNSGRGLIVTGPAGHGKTSTILHWVSTLPDSIMKHCLVDNNKKPLLRVDGDCLTAYSTRWMTQQFRNHGANWKTGKLAGALAGRKAIFIDDLGTESIMSNNFGNSVDVVHETLMDLFDSGGPVIMPFITTNLSPEQLVTRYDERIYGRILEYCNVFVLNETNHRQLVQPTLP
jgi:DNA replication protein DnaC